MSNFQTEFNSLLASRLGTNNVITTSDGIEIPYAIHNDFYYNRTSPVDFTIIFLQGQIQVGITQRPIQLLCECEERYADEVMKKLESIAQTYNESIVSFATSGNYREYYNTPMMGVKHQEDGINNRCTITMDISFITFSNVMNVSTFTLSTLDEDSEARTLNVKFTTFGIAYQTDASSTGYIDNGLVTEIPTSASTLFTFTYVPTLDYVTKSICQRCLDCDGIDTEYTLTLALGSGWYGCSDAISTYVKSVTYTQEAKGFPIVQVTLARRSNV